ncbi:MAG TPA: hypothetical protein VGA13_03745 [Acidimicrobiales bacterium]
MYRPPAIVAFLLASVAAGCGSPTEAAWPDGAVLSPTPDATIRPVDLELGCLGWAGHSGDDVRCGEWDTASGRRGWLIERDDVTASLQISLLRIEDGGVVSAAVARDTDGSYRGIEAEPFDLDGDGVIDAVAVGYRLAGTGDVLVVEVVEADDLVPTATVTLDGGRAAVGLGGVDVWEAVFAPEDPNCCPSAFRHSLLTREAQRWLLVEQAMVGPDDVPESQL